MSATPKSGRGVPTAAPYAPPAPVHVGKGDKPQFPPAPMTGVPPAPYSMTAPAMAKIKSGKR
jgi:hypothetical protein